MEHPSLGQREIVEGIEFTTEELNLIKQNGCTPEELITFVKNSSVQTITSAIGGVITIKAGRGQERNEPFRPAVGVDEEQGKTSTSDSAL